MSVVGAISGGLTGDRVCKASSSSIAKGPLDSERERLRARLAASAAVLGRQSKEHTLQKPKSLRPKGWPWRNPRAGASAEFARDMAKAEFGRNYVNDQQLEEVRCSLSRAKAQRAPAAENGAQRSPASRHAGSKKTR